MRIRRIRLVLPARMKPRAGAEARLIAEAAAEALSNGGAVNGPLIVQGAGRSGATLATEVSARIATAGPTKGKI